MDATSRGMRHELRDLARESTADALEAHPRDPWALALAGAARLRLLNAAAAVLVALWDREASADRAGREVEIAMIEAMGCFVGDQLVAAQVRGEEA